MRTYQNKTAQRERRWGAKIRLEENLKKLRKYMLDDPSSTVGNTPFKLQEKRMIKEIEILTARV